MHTTPLSRPRLGASLVAVASALPERVVSNDAIAERLGISDDWIVSRTGIHERRYADEATTVCGLAAEAAGRALDRAGHSPAEVDAILVATSSPDDFVPNTAPLVAERLGASRAAAIDVGAACTGWVSALALASGLLESGRARIALVIGAEIMSRLIDPDCRRTAALFGDGAGAAVLRATSGDGGIAPIVMRSDGSGAEAIMIPRSNPRVRMDGVTTFQNAVRRLAEVTTEALAIAGCSQGDIALYAYHQANGRILSAVADRLSLPADRVVNVVSRYGNTSSASIPIALADADADGRLKHGDNVLLAAFGGGFTWGGGVVQWRAAHT